MPTALPPVPVDQVEATLMGLARELTDAPPCAGPGRPRILPASLLWMGMIVCVLHGWSSQRSVWRLLSTTGLWQYPRIAVSDEAIYRRLAQGGTMVLETFFHQISAILAARLAPWPALGCAELAPFAPVVVAMDRTTLDPVLRTLPTLREVPTGDHDVLPGSLHGLFDLRTQQWRTVQYTDHPHQNEKVFARDLVATLPAGSLVLMDRGYFGFHLLDDLTDAKYRWIMRGPTKVSMSILHTHYHRGETLDAIVELGTYRRDRAKHAVRLITFRHGNTVYRYLTNVRDPHLLPAAEVAKLYARRWDIEMAFRLIKEHLGLHLLWSAKPQVLLQQVWAVLIIAQTCRHCGWRSPGGPGSIRLLSPCHCWWSICPGWRRAGSTRWPPSSPKDATSRSFVHPGASPLPIRRSTPMTSCLPPMI